MYEEIIDFLQRNGYVHYEISNFSKKGMGGVHNLKYWRNKEFIGAGLSAATYYKGKRTTRSEERRVGKECRSRWSPYH